LPRTPVKFAGAAPAASSERAATIGRLAIRPTLFQELRKEFPHTLPSAENLEFALVQRQFTAEAAEKAAKSYLATMALVEGNHGEYNPVSDAGRMIAAMLADTMLLRPV